MKKLLLIFLCISMPFILRAQEIKKQKEIGLVFSNLDNFGLTFKIGTEKSLWRFNTLFISGSNLEETTDSIVNKQNNMGFGIKFGKEYRKNIVENFELRFGADLSFTYSQTKFDYNDILNKQTTYQPGINLVLGLNYVLNDKFVIGAELLPHFSYITRTSIDNNSGNEVKNDISGFTYGLSNASALLSLAYRF